MPRRGENGQDAYLLTTIVDFTSETCPVVVGGCDITIETSFRSEIDYSGQ